jgi:Bacterial Ig-like domain
MNGKKFISFFLSAVVLYSILSIGNTGCANIVPPAGGPRDSLPPVPVNAFPKDSALRASSQKITIEFSEFIEIKNVSEKVLISPYPVKQPIIESKLRTITIRLKDSLLPNTTYTIDFGDAIVDLNEGNILKNFHYTFSTGNSIDTNELSGKIINAETGTTDSTFFALLYRKQEDSTVAKEKPLYVTRVSSKGNFKFTNLPAGTFYVYALLDADGDKKYSQPTEGFAFTDSPVIVSTATKPVLLYAYTEEKERPKPPPASNARGEKAGAAKRLLFTPNLEAGAQDLLDSLELTYTKPLKFVDSSKLLLFIDTIKPVTNLRVKYDTANKKIILFTQWKPGSNYRLVLNDDYAADTSGLKPMRNDTLNFKSKSEKEYGSILIRFKNLDLKKNPVLMLYENEKPVGSYPLTGNEWMRKMYKAGEYQVRILFDDNKNSRWDPGSFFSKPRRQPEKVLNVNVKVPVKPNWENESIIELGTQQ